MQPSEMRSLLGRIGIRPAKDMGQNFLCSDSVIQRSVREAHVGPGDTVLEIGGGVGNLTKALADTGAQVVTVEQDQMLAFHLETEMPDNVRVVHGDIMDQGQDELGDFNKVVANIPYSLSSPLIFKLLECDFDRGVLMLQHEFAQRLTAAHGSKVYGRLTVAAARMMDSRMLGRVRKGNFYPVPRVDSALVLMEPRAERFPVGDPEFFDAMLRVLFSQRRKMIQNSLGNGWCHLGEKCGVEEKAEGVALIPERWRKKRPEELSPEELGELAMALQTKAK